MTTVLTEPRSTYTPSGLREKARALHRPQVIIWNVGWLVVASAFALSVIGILAIETTDRVYAVKHLVHLALGLLGAAVVAVPHYRWAQRLSYVLMLAVLALLVFVLVPGVPEAIVRPRNGARRWIHLFVTDFQPSELAKIGYVLALANYLRFRRTYRSLPGLLLPLALTFVPMGLIVLEPDLGTAMLFLPTFFAMMIAAGAKLKHILLVIGLGLALAPAMYPLLKPHQKDRIQAMILLVQGDTSRDQDISFQGARAMTLVGSGGVAGHGRDHSSDLVHFNRLPEEHNDMIFAVICCRWGFLGASGVLLLYLAMCLGGMLVAGQCKDPFGRLVAVGLVAVLFAQMGINTAMTIGLVPITGMTLPFVSYGGSSLITTWLMVGLILNIGMRRPQYLARHSFEFDQGEAAASP